MSGKEPFDINAIKVASTYDPNDPFSPLPPTEQRPKMYENLNDILVRTSREKYLKERKQRLEAENRKKVEKNRLKQLEEARHKELLAEQEHFRKLKEERMKRQNIFEKKETTAYVERKRQMAEMWCKPMNRPTTNYATKAKNLLKKSSTQKSLLPVKKEDIFDFTPLNNKREKQLKTNKDENSRVKKEANSSVVSKGFDFVDDDNIPATLISNANARTTSDITNAQLSETAIIDNEFESSLSRPATPVNTENNLEPINIKEEFSDNFVKSEPNFDEYSNQDATRYFANDDDDGNDGDEDYDNDYEDNRSTRLRQPKPPQSRIVDSYDYSTEVNNEMDDLEEPTAMSTEDLVDIQGLVKHEVPDEYF